MASMSPASSTRPPEAGTRLGRTFAGEIDPAVYEEPRIKSASVPFAFLM